MPQQWHVNCLSDVVFAGKLTGLRVSSSQPILMLVYVVSTSYLKVCMYCCFFMLVDYVTDAVGSLLQLVHPVVTNIARKVCNLLQSMANSGPILTAFKQHKLWDEYGH